MHDAAQSLAYLHDAGRVGSTAGASSRYNGASWSSSSYGSLSGTAPAQSHLAASFVATPPPPAGVDPLTGRPFARAEHASSPHTNGGTPFNFPS